MKWGLGDSYENVQYIPVKARAYLDITKPASTLGVMGAYTLGSLFYFFYIGDPEAILSNYHTIIFVIITMGLAHGASQAMNMAEDAEMDRNTPHKQNRPIPSGIITEEEARTIAWFCILFALGRAYMVNSVFGGFVTVLIIFGVFYNLEPIRAKERIISIPWQAASRGLLSFPTIWAAYGDPTEALPWVLGLFMFWYVMGFQNSADIIDKEVDEKYGIKTFAVVFGIDGIVRIAYACIILMFLTIAGGYYSGIIPSNLIWILLIIPFCFVMLYHMAYNSDDIDKNTGNHPAWIWFYIGMVLCVAIPLAVEGVEIIS